MATKKNFFACAWGKVRLWLTSIETDEGRDVAVQQFTRGNVPHLNDSGDVPKIARCELLLEHDMLGETKSPREKIEDIRLLKLTGKPQLFTHPLYGTYLAYLQDFRYAVDECGNFTGSVSFVAAEEVDAVTVDPIGVSLDVAADSIAVRNQELLDELESVDLSSDVPDKATAAAATFDSDSATARDKLVALSSTTDRMWEEIEEKQLAADVALYPLLRTYVMLGEAIRAGADTSLGDLGAYMTIKISEPTSLRRLMADLYGASEAEARRQEAIESNDIRTPARMPAGTTLRLRQPAR